VQSNGLCVSIISHNNGENVNQILPVLLECDEVTLIVLTINVRENVPVSIRLKEHERVRLIINDSPRSFAYNHNRAFTFSKHQFFCVINPDVIINYNPFPFLLETLDCGIGFNIGVLAPHVDVGAGEFQCNARKFPTPFGLLLRFLTVRSDSEVLPVGRIVRVDWVSGCLMLFRSEVYRRVQGLDESFGMYCEDLDICRRMSMLNLDVVVDGRCTVQHVGARKSHWHPIYFFKHVRSWVIYGARCWLKYPRYLFR